MGKSFIVTADALNVRSGPGTNFEVVGSLANGESAVSPDTEGWLPVLRGVSIGWVSAKYLQEAPVAAPGIEPAIGQCEPPWISWARKQLGEKEVPGAGDNPDIVAWFQLTTLPKDLWHDATAWCAVFVNAGFCLNGINGLRSARAADWLGFGHAVTTPQIGDVVVFRWDDGSHHVAYVLGIEGDRVRVIGGNQSNAVTETTYPLRNVAGFRRPV